MAIQSIISDGVSGATASLVGTGQEGLLIISGEFDEARVATSISAEGHSGTIPDTSFRGPGTTPVEIPSGVTLHLEIVGGSENTLLNVGLIT